VSGPLLDRIDIQVEVPGVAYKELADHTDHTASECSADIRKRVERACKIQLQRFAGRDIYCNAQMTARDLRKHCHVDAGADRLMESAMNSLGLSARAHTRILKVARTIADLDGAAEIGAAHVAEAIQYRSLDRSFH
jgi:magnesium chelatase family protein